MKEKTELIPGLNVFAHSAQNLRVLKLEEAKKGNFCVEISSCLLNRYGTKVTDFRREYISKTVNKLEMHGDITDVRREKPYGMIYLTFRDLMKVVEYSYQKGFIRYCTEEEARKDVDDIIKNFVV